MAPGTKFSTSTSDASIRCGNTFLAPCSDFMSSVTLFLLRSMEKEIGRLIALEWRGEGAGVVALARPLDLDHLCTEIAQLGIVQYGPERTLGDSTSTRIPSSGRIADLLIASNALIVPLVNVTIEAFAMTGPPCVPIASFARLHRRCHRTAIAR